MGESLQISEGTVKVHLEHIFRKAGVRTDGALVFLSEKQVLSAIATVPRQFTLHARNPYRTVTVGGGAPVFAPGYGAPFLVDATVTLCGRLLRGERVWQAHRDHYYQRLVRMGWSHRRTALAEYALMAVLGVSGLVIVGLDPPGQALGLTLAAAVLVALMAAVDSRWRAFTRLQGQS